jgi:hypothetical protein
MGATKRATRSDPGEQETGDHYGDTHQAIATRCCLNRLRKFILAARRVYVARLVVALVRNT